MKVVIMAGGLGSRLAEETSQRPKPMVEIGGSPILWHIMKIYSHYGLTDFVICLGYKGFMIKEYFANMQLHECDVTIDLGRSSIAYHNSVREPWRVTLVDTGAETLTGGRLKRVAQWLTPDEPFCMTYGDGVADIDIAAQIAFHRRHGAEATITAVAPPSRYGALDLDANDRVERFVEKPHADNSSINGGFFVLEPRVVSRIAGDATPFEGAPLESLARDGELVAFRHNGFWAAMDTLRDRNHLEGLWAAGTAPWAVWGAARVTVADKAFWRGRRVLITGHTGFKGAWLCLRLAGLGARVTGLALDPVGPSLFGLAEVGSALEDRRGDIRHDADIAAAIEAARPEVVFHLAAQAIVRAGLADPIATLDTNIMGTARVFQALRHGEAGAIVAVTSDKVYLNRDQGLPFAEDAPLGGSDPYSGSKSAAEMVVRLYRESFGLPLVSARAGNVIGGGDFAADRLLPDAWRALAAGQALTLRRPGSTRPWSHVLDIVEGYLLYAEAVFARRAGLPTALNFGPAPDAAPLTALETVETFAAALGRPLDWRQDPAPFAEKSQLAIDSTAARAALGWSERLPGAEAVRATAAWYGAWAGGADPADLSHDMARQGLDLAAAS